MGINDISANDIVNGDETLPRDLTVAELYTPESLRPFWRAPIRRTKLLKKGLVSLTSIGQIRRLIADHQLGVAIGDLRGDLFAGESDMNGYVHRPGQVQRQVGDDPFVAIFRDLGDAVPGRNAGDA